MDLKAPTFSDLGAKSIGEVFVSEKKNLIAKWFRGLENQRDNYLFICPYNNKEEISATCGGLMGRENEANWISQS